MCRYAVGHIILRTVMVIPEVKPVLGMKIKINDEWLDVAEEVTLQNIVTARLGERQNGIAVAVNSKIIPKAERSTFRPGDGDHILIIKATQGG